MINNIELFAGAGGLADGLEQSGNVHLLASVEWLKPQVRTLRKRLETKYSIKDASERVLNFDIQRTEELINGWTNDTEFETSVGLDKLIGGKSVDMISGGPPCQAYSLAGRIRDKNGMKDDYRNFLFESYIRLVDYYKPKIILFENVEGMLSAIPTGENITDLIRNGFDSIGYEIIDDLRKYALIDLSNYGVPQKRKRVIILGVRRDSKDTDYQKILQSFYTELLPSRMTKVKTVRDAISDLPPIYPLKEQIGRNAYDNSNAVNGHSSRFHSLRDQKIFNLLAQDIVDGTKKYTSAEALKQLYFETTGKNSNVHKYHVLRWDEPSNTIPAHLKKDGLRHIHPDPNQKRSITVREAARLQTFDDDFEFNESQLANFEMIGNAVPPLFAKVIGDLLPQFLDQIKLEEME
ncbi:DNA cytosine methyltransferase [Streptococcus suis]|uniref:DNA cytosine methyltransferase n=1 Tax=Streptococcus suis TaxID=1307 RepID=UPI003B9F561A